MEDIVKARMKFGEGGRCVTCGAPTDSVSIRCGLCLDKAYLADELLFARNWLGRYPEEKIELAHDAAKEVHLVCFHCRNIGWCGAKLTQLKLKRKSITAGNFPSEGMCVACRGLYRDLECGR